MNLQTLLYQSRVQMDDVVAPNFWSDADLTFWLNEAIDEVCLRTRGIMDSTTPPICSLQTVPFQQRYDIDPSVIKIERVRVGSNPVPLKRFTMGLMDDKVEYWDSPFRSGIPQFFFTDQDQSDHLVLVLVPYPSYTDTMQLSVWRMPIACEYLVGPKDQPPLRIFLHRGLTDWVEYKAYSRKDAETLDDGRSDKALARFTARYGERPSGVSLKLMGANALRGTQPEWF